MTEPSAEVDFLLFKGRRITDVDDDARDEKALVGGGLPSPCASVAELPMDASLLAVCNVRGVLFAGAPGAPALRWGRLAALSAALVPGGADVASLLSEVPLPAAPLVVALSCDGARLVVATEDGATSLALHLYDVAGLLRGAHAPAATHSLALGGALLALQWSPSAPLQMLAADASGGVTLLAWGAAAGAPTAASTADVAGLRSGRTPPTAPPSSSATPTAGSAAARSPATPWAPPRRSSSARRRWTPSGRARRSRTWRRSARASCSCSTRPTRTTRCSRACGTSAPRSSTTRARCACG